jgi:integrase
VSMGRKKSAWLDLPPRMAARVLPSGKILYYYQAAGKKVPLGADLSAAKLEWARLEAGESKAVFFPAIADLFERAKRGAVSLSTRRHYETALEQLSEFFKNFTMEQIRPKDVKAYMRGRSKKPSAVFEKRVLSALWNWAREEDHTSAPNPCTGVKFSEAEKRAYGLTGGRQTYVTDADFAEVHARGDHILQDCMDLAVLTGQRPGDILKMTRQDIRDGALWVVQIKTGAKVGIRLEGELERVVERILARPRAVPSMYLICDHRGQRVRYNALNERFRAARGEATWQFRDIRAKTASDSDTLKEAQHLLGHRNETTTAGVYRRAKGNVVAPLKRKNLEPI